MKIYKDAELTDEVIEGEVINFGVVRAGEGKKVTLYIVNDTEAILQKFEYEFIPKTKEGEEPKDDKITVIDSPPIMRAQETQSFTMLWEPDLDYKRALKTTIKIRAEEVYI